MKSLHCLETVSVSRKPQWRGADTLSAASTLLARSRKHVPNLRNKVLSREARTVHRLAQHRDLITAGREQESVPVEIRTARALDVARRVPSSTRPLETEPRDDLAGPYPAADSGGLLKAEA
jgi:hypothetical protein